MNSEVTVLAQVTDTICFKKHRNIRSGRGASKWWQGSSATMAPQRSTHIKIIYGHNQITSYLHIKRYILIELMIIKQGLLRLQWAVVLVNCICSNVLRSCIYSDYRSKCVSFTIKVCFQVTIIF